MSAVYLARDPVLSRLVAIKVLHPDLLLQKILLQRFFKEAKTVARLNSPHVVGIFDFGEEQGAPFLVMEFIDGQTMQGLINQLDERPVHPIIAAAMIEQAAEGLAVASESGVVHRDLKPENLMLSQSGYLKITDFGISHLKDHTMTHTGMVVGTPQFMSPEQVKGLKPITAQSDLFSLGAVFYYLLSGRVPFRSDNPQDLYRKIVSVPHEPLSSLCPELDKALLRVVDMLLDKNPAKRGKGPRELQWQLKRYLVQRKVVDPAQRIAEYIRDLSSQGFQTTSHLNPERIRELMGSLDLGHSVRRSKTKAILWSVGALVLVAFGIATTFRAFLHSPAPIAVVSAPKTLSGSYLPGTLKETAPRLEPVSLPVKTRTEQPAPTNEAEPPLNPVDLEPADRFQEPPAPPLVSLITAPPFVDVYLDGKFLGRTPIKQKAFQPGKHLISFRSKLGLRRDTALSIVPGEQTYRFSLMENPDGDSKGVDE